jgi:hypothetical protein
MEISHRRAERFYLKLLLGTLVAIVLLIAVFWGGRDLYVRWQERRLVRRAVFDIEHGNERDANLAARTILGLNPSSAPAARIMAQLAERAGERAALDWRRKVAHLEPASTEDALALARCALQFNEVGTAERALSGIAESGRHTAGYHAVAALLAQARRQNEKAEVEWTEALRLAPEEKAYQLELGTLRVRATDLARHASGEAILNALREDTKQRAFATRALISAGVARREEPHKLLELARELQAYPEATWGDHLSFLNLLHELHDPQFSSYLTELEKTAAAKSVSLAMLLSWMSQKSLSLLALDFSKNLPAEELQKWPVPVALADAYVQLKDWRKLELAIQNAKWQQFDYLRHAYLARALRGQAKPAAAEREWATAVKGAAEHSESLLLLVRTAAEWGWETETTDLLWALSRHPEKQKEAFLALYRHYSKSADTQGLYRVLLRLFETDPTNLDVQNNLAQISLLLNANPDEGRRLATDLYQKAPTNPSYVTTYAYALYSKGNVKQALNVMESLKPELLERPEIAAYYGVFLVRAGANARAAPFLELADKATLLAEEKALVEAAKKQAQGPVPSNN